MKVKEILKNVCIYLGKEELLDSAYFTEGGEDLSKLNLKDLEKMKICLEFISNEIASEYLPILKQKEVTLKNGEINVFDIDENIQEVVSIKTKFGKNLKYKFIDNKIIALATNVTVTYKVNVNGMTLDGEAESFGGRLSSRVLGYGTASEYCYQEMLYDDASIWESRYKNALLNSCRKKGEIKLKTRGWI